MTERIVQKPVAKAVLYEMAFLLKCVSSIYPKDNWIKNPFCEKCNYEWE